MKPFDRDRKLSKDGLWLPDSCPEEDLTAMDLMGWPRGLIDLKRALGDKAPGAGVVKPRQVD